ncbi:hypothetical protein JCM8097_001139 [Rhodosporidiobolus ruineniae]
MSSAPYVALPQHARLSLSEEKDDESRPPTPLSSFRWSASTTSQRKRLYLLAAGAVALLIVVASASSHPPSRAYVSTAFERLRGQGAEAEYAPEEEMGRPYKATEVEEQLRRYRWKATPDESLQRALATLSADERRVRDWLLASRPSALRGTSLQYASPVSPVTRIIPGPPAKRHASPPGRHEGPGSLNGGSWEKYGELIKEWETGRMVLHTEAGKWQKGYKKLHAEMLQGERPTEILEYVCLEGRECGGLADRMFGMLSTFFLAVMTNRAYLVSWDQPVPLSLIFDSPAIDWSGGPNRLIPSLSPEEGGRPAHPLWDNQTLVQGRDEMWVQGREWPVEDYIRRLRSDNAEDGLLDKPWVRFANLNRGMAIHSFSVPSLLGEVSAKGMSISTVYAQIVHFLFRPKLEVLMFIHEYVSLFSLPSVFSIGIQIRTGDMFMGNAELDEYNTVERYQQYFTCAEEVAATYASPGQRPLWYLITDSAALRRNAAAQYPDRVVVSGLAQHHNELRVNGQPLAEAVTHAGSGGKASVEQLESEIEGMQNTVAESWIFSDVDFALLSYDSGFGKIPTFVHAHPDHTIVVPRTRTDPTDPNLYGRPTMPSCRLETTLSSFTDLANSWSQG